MGQLCHTDIGESWNVKSKAGVLLGNFEAKEDGNGFFSGIFAVESSEEKDPILGRCWGNRIYFFRAGAKAIFYVGTFQGNDLIVDGKTVDLSGVGLQEEGQGVEDEEWQGEKVPTLATNALTANCRTNPGEAWFSEVEGSDDGSFEITSEDSSGNITGFHSSGDPIDGTCTGAHMTIFLPSNDPVFRYSGSFNPAKDRVHGHRRNLKSPRDNELVTDDENWEGVKTGT
jgi:hypothetical protein